VLKFVINSQNLSLPSEDNLRRWGKASVDSHCHLVCSKTGKACGQRHPTALHVLTGCKVALEQGRYTWRHDSLLLVLKQHLVPHIAAINSRRIRINPSKPLRFIREDGMPYNDGKSIAERSACRLDEYLAQSTDWQLLFDLRGDQHCYTVFPPEVASTAQRPDIVLLSRSAKLAVCLELTCPTEERVLIAHELKADKYAHLIPEAAQNGWRLNVWPVEVGCRGCVAFSMAKALRAFRFPRSQQLLIKQQLEDVALRCMYYIFCSRMIASWVDRPLLASGGALDLSAFYDS
jgi:hypothetical protein